MQSILILALALFGVTYAAPAPQAPYPADIQLSIQNTELLVLAVIEDFAQQHDASSDFSGTGRSLDSLRRVITPSCPSVASPPPAVNTTQAIQYLQQVQLTLDIVAEDVLNGDTTSATDDMCAAVNQYAAVANVAQSSGSSVSVVSPPPFTSTTSTSTSSASATPTSCQDQEDACRTAPNANQAFCSSQAAQCQDTCANTFDACATAPNANHAYCASQYSACLGYNPFQPTTTSGGPSSTSTSTSGSPSATIDCQSQENSCRTAPNANQAFCSSQASQCQTACTDSYERCITAPSANVAYCASVYAACLGYSPFTGSSTSSITTSAATTTAYGCNPAHSYPSPVTCIQTDGSLTLVTPTPTVPTPAT